jgi:hypothetical protein
MMNLKLEDVDNIEDMQKVDTSSWEDVSRNIRLRLINQKVLEYYDKDIASKQMFDLAMTASVQERNEDSVRSHMLTNQELENYGVTVDEAIKKAIENSENDKSRRLLSLRESLMSKNNLFVPISETPISGPIMMQTGNFSNNGMNAIVNDINEDEENVVVVTSSKGKLGASYGMLSSTIQEVYDRFDHENFYIVPMSTDEMMYIKQSYATNNGKKPLSYVEDDILDMLELNNQKVNGDWKNIMSYRAYYYSGDDGNSIIPVKR